MPPQPKGFIINYKRTEIILLRLEYTIESYIDWKLPAGQGQKQLTNNRLVKKCFQIKKLINPPPPLLEIRLLRHSSKSCTVQVPFLDLT